MPEKLSEREIQRLANAGRHMGKPVRKPKKKFDPKKISPERQEEIDKAAEELWGKK